ncbi:hypothetical protein [Bifidobacterium catenulatum]|nr:hypothetical protein [Bifidobacterium catenulatum]
MNVFRDFNPMALTLHIMFIVLPWPLLFSLLISLDTEPASTPPKQRFSLSSVTAFVVLAVTVAVLLIVWYVALGFSNPNRICEIYNAAHGIADAVTATPYQPMV